MALNHTHTGPSASGNPRHDTENGRKKTQLGGRSDNTVLNRESRWKQRRTHEHRGTEGRQFGRFADTMLKDVRVLPWHANWHTFTDVCCCNNNRKGEVGRSLWTLSSTTKKKQTNKWNKNTLQAGRTQKPWFSWPTKDGPGKKPLPLSEKRPVSSWVLA